MNEVKIPSAVVYGFIKPRELVGEVPLFTRVPLSGTEYPAEFASLKTLAQSTVTKDNISFDWVIVSAKVSITRFWACSTAVLTLACDLLDPREPLKLPPIHPEMPLRIKLGYVPSLYGFPDPNNLETVFTGYVDTISLKLMSKRVIATVSLRDPIRFLTDTRLTMVYDAEDSGLHTTYNLSGRPRGDLIQDIIVDGSGVFYDSTGKDTSTAIPRDRVLIPYESTRLPLPSTESGEVLGNYFNILNRTPIEVVRHLSSMEGFPMELYADRNGNVIWTRREIVNMENEDTVRHFWYRQPVEMTTGIVNPIISANLEWTSIGVFNEFVVVNASSLVEGGSVGGTVMRYGRMKTMDALGYDMPTRTRFIFDDTLLPTVDPRSGAANTQESIAFLNGMFMIHGKDVRAGSIEIPGDPGLFPGMGIMLWNVGMYQPPDNIFRVSAVVHGFTASGPKAGFRSNVVFDAPITRVEGLYTTQDKLYGRDANVDPNTMTTGEQ